MATEWLGLQVCQGARNEAVGSTWEGRQTLLTKLGNHRTQYSHTLRIVFAVDDKHQNRVNCHDLGVFKQSTGDYTWG